MADDWKKRFKKYVEDNKPKDSALSSTEEDSLQDEYDSQINDPEYRAEKR